MWREQSKAYRKRMGFLQEDLAAVLGVTKEAVVDHERGGEKAAQPPVNRASEYAQRMLVSLDWMGDISQQMWSADTLLSLRSAIRVYITEHREQLEALGLDQRICALLRLTHNFNSEKFTPLLLSGVARLVAGGRVTSALRDQAMELMHSILAGANPELPNLTPDYLAEFWQVSAPWLMNTEGEPILVDVTPHISSIRLLEEYGLLNFDFITQHLYVLKELNSAMRHDAQESLEQA